MSRPFIVLAGCFFSALNYAYGLFGRTTVREVGIEEFDKLLRHDTENIAIVDVREPGEIAVSIIPGAISKERFEETAEQHRHRKVIVYCTLGGRSFLYARSLCKLGFDATNFQPSILGWCWANRDLTTPDGTETNRVHTYSTWFNVPDRYDKVP